MSEFAPAMPHMSIAVIIAAAGKGERISRDAASEPKQYRTIAGAPVLTRTIGAFLDLPEITAVLPVIHPDHAARYAALGLADDRLLPHAVGGSTRQASVMAGLRALASLQPDLVLIQDA
ncbi:MAG: 2-C-methyl-D-erythritol 4-phosphate cytidylyltransferase, partial [Candidatus Devosia euplotis]|nr:2-C-methyl-D-erythritol 4-phosphate cytidylyltransferase [Candidatus Devosia euplotis]